MATYVLPQVQVFQEFSVTPTVTTHPLQAHITGPHAQLVRYAQTGERATGLLDYYDSLIDTDYSWPGLPAGAVIDPDYTKLWIHNALLRYFQTSIGNGYNVTKLASYSNRIHSSVLNFATHDDDERDAVFLDRDVRVGDIVKIRGVDTEDESQTLWSSVKALHSDQTAAVVGAATADDDNQGNQGASTSISMTAGIHNGIAATADGSSYDGLASGYVTETYDVIVTRASVDGDYTQALVRVISGSGTDDQSAVVPGHHGHSFAVGTRGLLMTFTDDDLSAESQSAADAGVPVDELILGQRWRITVHQAFTAPTATSGGSYTGEADATYIITVNKGGVWADQPTISVTTTTGSDISGPTKVTASAVFVAVGTQGVQIKFTGTNLRAGDVYYIEATAAVDGAVKQIELANSLPATLADGTELDLSLYILRTDLEVTQDRIGAPPLLNWEQTASTFTTKSGIEVYDPTWTDGGVQQLLPVIAESTQGYGQAYVEYRAWLQELCSEVWSITDVGTLDAAISGALDPDNPLKWAVFMALQNANGVPVLYTAVCNPADANSWAEVIELLVGRTDVYSLVPLTYDATILGLFAAHVAAMSTPEQAAWRVAWFGLQGMPEIPIVADSSTIVGHMDATTSDGEPALCTITDDPQTAGTQYTLLTCTSDNALFVTNGVRAGDIVRTQYTGDGFGGSTYSEYVVAAVRSEEQLVLVSGPTSPVNVGVKTEIWRTLAAADEATEIGRIAASYNDRRIRAVWPDTIEGSGFVMAGYFACAALAALSGGVVPQQGLTHLQLAGFTAVTRTTKHFNRAALDSMAGSGVFIVTQDPAGNIFARHAVTTAPYSDINSREENITRNVDSISYQFQEFFAPYIGVTNVTAGMIALITTDVESLVSTLKTQSATATLGGQLIDAQLVGVSQSVIARDQIVVQLILQVPYALNNLTIFLTI